jgi:hypothetical protein
LGWLRLHHHPTPRVVIINVFAEYPLRHSMDLVELGARSMDLVDLEFLELGFLLGKNGVELFFGSGTAWSSPKHTLNPSRPQLATSSPSQLASSLLYSDGISIDSLRALPMVKTIHRVQKIHIIRNQH